MLGARRLFRQGDSGTRPDGDARGEMIVTGAVPEGFLRPPGERDAFGGHDDLGEGGVLGEPLLCSSFIERLGWGGLVAKKSWGEGLAGFKRSFRTVV